MGAVLLPVAIRAGLPALGVAMAMNLFGHGIALSGDFVIQGAPKLTADAAGLPVSQVIHASIPLVIVMGVVTTLCAFYFLKRDLKNGKLTSGTGLATVAASSKESTLQNGDPALLSSSQKRFFALLVPVLFALDIVAMYLFQLQGGDATALIGGTSIVILLLISMAGHKGKGLEKTTSYLIEGFQFGFKVFGPVIPILCLLLPG